MTGYALARRPENPRRPTLHRLIPSVAVWCCVVVGPAIALVAPTSQRLHHVSSPVARSSPAVQRRRPPRSRSSGGTLRIAFVIPNNNNNVPTTRLAASAADSSSSSSGVEADEAVVARWRWAARTASVLAGLGVLETSYLTYQKVSGAAAPFCGGTAGAAAQCSSVLTGPYSSVMGVPLSALGLLSYASVLALCAWSLVPTTSEATTMTSTTTTSDGDRDAALGRRRRRAARQDRVATTKLPLVALTAFMAAFSSYLVVLLVAKLHTSCAFCFASAALSWSLFAVVQRAARDERDALFGATVASMAAASLAAGVALYLGDVQVALDDARAIAVALSQQRAGGGPAAPIPSFASPFDARSSASSQSKGPGAAAQFQQQQKPPAVTFAPPSVETTSTPRTLAVARELKARGARVYGAYWCSHCFAQKEKFGKEAAAMLDYVECAADGDDSRRAECQARGVAGYPTWDIDGKLYPGEKSIADIEALLGIDASALADARLPAGTE